MENEKPYIKHTYTKVITEYKYNPNYGDDRVCECGHPYYRHFDTYENMYPIGVNIADVNILKKKKKEQ